MLPRLASLPLALLLVAMGVSSTAAAELPPFTVGHSQLRITNSPPQSQADEVKWRLHAEEYSPPYNVAKEKFELIVPKTYTHDNPHGLFIWISAGAKPAIPAEWEKALAARKLIFAGAYDAGNPRNIFDRVKMAVDANYALRQRFNVDARRVYVSGFSGGARVASMVGVAWADMFTGTIPFMGANFYTDVRAEDGKTYTLDYLPDDEVLAIAKKRCSYVLITGEKDFNRANIKAVFELGFRQEKFLNPHYLEVPKQGHSLPPAQWLEDGLKLLDGDLMTP